EVGGQGLPVSGGEETVGALRIAPVKRPPPDRIIGRPPLRAQGPLVDLAGAGERYVVGDADEPGRPLGAEVVLVGQELREGDGIEAGSGDELQGEHHLIAGARVGNGIDSGGDDTGKAGHDAFYGSGGEILPVDAQPVRRPAGGVEKPRLVAVAEVTGPEPTPPGPFGVGLFVGVVALEAPGAIAADDLPDGLG